MLADNKMTAVVFIFFALLGLFLNVLYSPFCSGDLWLRVCKVMALCMVVSVITAIGIGMFFFHSSIWFLDLPFALGIPAILLIVTLSFQNTSK
jgi:uncharacterized membrane protein